MDCDDAVRRDRGLRAGAGDGSSLWPARSGDRIDDEPASLLASAAPNPGDTDALYEICLLTADSGVDASGLYSDRRLPGYIWAAAYGSGWSLTSPSC